MKILILGASGHIGKVLVARLQTGPYEITCASRGRRATSSTGRQIILDSRDTDALTRTLGKMDAVINCVAGDADSIAKGAAALVDAALAAGRPRIIHLSTMAVYGHFEGIANEEAPFDPSLGWYAAAKCQAEQHMTRFGDNGGAAVVLRPGCVYGPGSALWVGRIGRWLQSGRIGDLGAGGDGWSNLVHVDDVCTAIVNGLGLELGAGDIRRFNLAAPDSPRWNDYFGDLADAIGATPLRRPGMRRMRLDARLFGPPLKVLELLAGRLKLPTSRIPDPIPPALLQFFAQQIYLDSTRAGLELNMSWSSYASNRLELANWFRATGK